MGTHLRVLSESYPMNTNMTGFNLCVLVLWTKVDSTLEGLTLSYPGFHGKGVVLMYNTYEDNLEIMHTY